MNDEAKQIVKDLRLHGFDNPSCLGTHMGICDIAADMIEKLSADRDAWQRRAEAAERDMGYMIPCVTCKKRPMGEAPCDANVFNGLCRSNYKWRGPREKNGGAENGG